MNRRPSAPLALPLAALAILTLTACLGPQPEPPDEPAQRVESIGLGFAIAALPSAFTVIANQGDELILEAEGPARLVAAVGPESGAGINLVAEVKNKKSELESLPGAQYFGNRELMTPIGTAFTARAAYEKEGTPVEETWIFALHPSANRLLTLTYTYPPGQSEQRVQELIGVLAEIEGIGFQE